MRSFLTFEAIKVKLFVFRWPQAHYNAGLAVVAATTWDKAEKLLQDTEPWCKDQWQRESEIQIGKLAARKTPRLIACQVYKHEYTTQAR